MTGLASNLSANSSTCFRASNSSRASSSNETTLPILNWVMPSIPSLLAADKEDWPKILKDFMAKEYRKALAMGQDKDFTNATGMGEFWEHGCLILDYL